MTTGNPTQWRIDVIKVPLAAPETAAIVSQPRIFTDPATGAFNGLQNTPPGAAAPVGHPRTARCPNTNTCHDITAYPEIGLAAGACQGNGILLDISDPVNPVRLDAVADPNFSYWHSATFNNDGTKVIFTDEWGGGTSARCRVTDQPQWGADALFDIVDGKLEFASYYKLPGAADDAGELRRPQRLDRAGAGSRHHGAGLVPGRPVGDRLHRHGEPGRDRVLRPRPDQHAEPDRPEPRRLLVDVLVQRQRLGSEIARGFDSLASRRATTCRRTRSPRPPRSSSTSSTRSCSRSSCTTPSFAVARSYFDQAERDGSLSGNALNRCASRSTRPRSSPAGPASRRAVGRTSTTRPASRALPADSGPRAGAHALAGRLG